MKQAIIHVAREYDDEVLAFFTAKLGFTVVESLYETLWDLLQLREGHPAL